MRLISEHGLRQAQAERMWPMVSGEGRFRWDNEFHDCLLATQLRPFLEMAFLTAAKLSSNDDILLYGYCFHAGWDECLSLENRRNRQRGR